MSNLKFELSGSTVEIVTLYTLQLLKDEQEVSCLLAGGKEVYATSPFYLAEAVKKGITPYSRELKIKAKQFFRKENADGLEYIAVEKELNYFNGEVIDLPSQVNEFNFSWKQEEQISLPTTSQAELNLAVTSEIMVVNPKRNLEKKEIEKITNGFTNVMVVDEKKFGLFGGIANAKTLALLENEENSTDKKNNLVVFFPELCDDEFVESLRFPLLRCGLFTKEDLGKK